MQYFAVAALALGLLGSANAAPAGAPGDAFDHFVFHAGPVDYALSAPQNGNTVYTNQNLNVNLIDVPDYQAVEHCHFTYAGPAVTNPPALTFQVGANGQNQLAVGPPSVITAVTCSY